MNTIHWMRIYKREESIEASRGTMDESDTKPNKCNYCNREEYEEIHFPPRFNIPVFQGRGAEFKLELSPQMYFLYSSALKSYISWLVDERVIDGRFEDGRLYLFRVE